MNINSLREKWKLVLGAAGLLIVLVIGGFSASEYFFFNTHGATGSFTKVVSGLFTINGVIPPGSTITLFERKARTNDSFVPFATNISPQDQSAWGFIKGQTGSSYEIMATLVNNGAVIASAGPISVTVPAINQMLTFNVTSANPPATSSATQSATATISGTVHIDGYIPPSATLSLQRRKQGGNYFSIVGQDIAAEDGEAIIFPSQIPGQTYEVKALLYSAQLQLIGTSEILTVVAPAAHQTLHINSTAVPPATPTPLPTAIPVPTIQTRTTPVPTITPTPTPQITIAGTISFQGQAPLNSRIVILERTTGSQSYQVAIDNISPQDGISWKWTGAVTAQMYDFVAVLKQKQSDGTDKDISSSNTLTISAPASNETLSINSGFLLPAPSSSISISCNSYSSSSQTWSAGISFPSVTGAQSYWYEIGTTDGGVELTNFTQNATNNTSQSFTYQLKNGVKYYARYAYAPFPNLGANNSQFSPFSSTTQVSCSQ